eukprot:CAMPEP_0196570718 /NCGR_PEP_ID=MMETSP1081-20130531/878_1 /TAXON_ID=36882 /ORGANISM="Pyramimonas amylifera, Strain CCMP720" /LENGTH=639 /DNA_ID=CAMNT_0041887325 /DNA_START=118 /DNA_END=2037 /DNA_ORIENTATION=-
MLRLLLLSILSISAGNLGLADAADAEIVQLPTVSLEDLLNPTKQVYSDLSKALADFGLLAVALDDKSASSTTTALTEYTRCVTKAEESVLSELFKITLDDGSHRTSLGTATNHSIAQPFSAIVVANCPEFATSAAPLRSTVDATGKAIAKVLDHLTGDDKATSSAELAEEDSFQWVTENAESLEHFHLFTRDENSDVSESPALHMHSDMGLFIVMTPAQYLPLQEGEGTDSAQLNGGGLFLELADGRVVKPSFPMDSFLVMGGEGSRLWVRRPKSVPFFAPGHEVVLPKEMVNLGRAWYGRMFLPSRAATYIGQSSAQESNSKITFNEFRDQTYNAFHNGKPETALALGCHASPAGSRRQLAAEDNCTATEIMCWHSCMVVEGCQVSEAQCIDMANGLLWQGDDHNCMMCAPQCPGDDNETMPEEDHSDHDHDEDEHHDKDMTKTKMVKGSDGFYTFLNDTCKLKHTITGDMLTLDVMAITNGWVGVAWALSGSEITETEAVIGYLMADSSASSVDTYLVSHSNASNVQVVKGSTNFTISDTAVVKMGDWTHVKFTRSYPASGAQQMKIASGVLQGTSIGGHKTSKYSVFADFAADDVYVMSESQVVPSPPPEDATNGVCERSVFSLLIVSLTTMLLLF